MVQAFIKWMSLKHGINLTHPTPNVLSHLRAAAGNEENINHYYQLLEQIVHDYHIDVSSLLFKIIYSFLVFTGASHFHSPSQG